MNRIIEVAVDVGRHLFADRRDVGECPPPTSPSRPLHPNCPSVEVPSAPVMFVADLRHLLDVPGQARSMAADLSSIVRAATDAGRRWASAIPAYGDATRHVVERPP